VIGSGLDGEGRKPLFIRSALAGWCVLLLLLSLNSSAFAATNAPQQPVAHSSSTAKEESQKRQPNSIKVGIVKQKVDGCLLQLPADYKKQNDRDVFNSGDENSTDDCECAFMNLDGRLVRLNRIYSKWPHGGPDKVGKRGVQIYTAKGTKVEVDWVVTHVCGPRDGEECEGTDFSATVKITRRDESTTLKVLGGCGP
jgi:hypothetical protein